MSENNKSYRIRTNVGSEYNGDIRLDVNLLQDYDEFEILSLKIGTENLYKYHTSHYGCVVGRVLANGGVGVPNVKISSFIPVEDVDTADPIFSFLYPYTSTRDKNREGIRYNLLTDTKIDDCHQAIGTFPNKRLVLDDNNVIEIYDKYYKFTTTTNGSGDYMLFGLPVGNNIIHSDLDLSDIGILSQKPRDMFYKGYTAKQFENASQFKKDTNLDNLTQVISQDSSVYVFPFWGDETENEGQIKIVRNDIDVNYKFEPTCIFIGCIVSDEKSNAISKNCIPHERMGKMDRLTTGAGTIEMIRKTISGDIESFTIQGNELIDGNGTWCYQIPMNLDYMATDEYGVLVPTDDYNKGLPTRASVRFRVSLADYESDYENAHLVKVLVPNNPDVATKKEGDETIRYVDYDYEFGSATQDKSFRNMFWNNVYTVKSYIPRFQKGNRQKNKNFTGFKSVNVNGANNPLPYNNMRINLTFLFVFQCLIFKSLVLIVKTLNKIINVINQLRCNGKISDYGFACGGEEGLVYLTLDGGMCPTLDGNYIAPGAANDDRWQIIQHTYKNVYGDEIGIKFNIKDMEYNNPPGGEFKTETGTSIPYDEQSADGKNSDLKGNGVEPGKISTGYTVDDVAYGDEDSEEKTRMKIYNTEDYFVKCVELQFAMEYEVIQFDFYNDWINGMIYIPRWFAEIRKNKDRAHYCGNTFTANRMLTQQCAIAYNEYGVIANKTDFKDTTLRVTDNDYFPGGCRSGKQQCHKRWGRKQVKIFGKNRGIVMAEKNSRGQYAYYLRPSELILREDDKNVKANLFSTDIVLLGSVLECNQYGVPKVNGYTSSSYKMPPPLAEIISDTQDMVFDNDVDVVSAVVNAAIDAMNDQLSSFNDIMDYKYTIVSCDMHSDSDDTALRNIAENYYGSRVGDLVDLELKLFCIEDYFNYFNKIASESSVTIPTDFYITNNEDYNQYVYYNGGVIDYSRLVDAVINNTREIVDNCLANILAKSQMSSVDCENYPILQFLYSILSTKTSSIYSPQTLRRIINEACKTVVLTYGNSGKINHFYKFIKKTVDKVQLDDSTELTYSELSGIDWGYNPFKAGGNDNTTEMENQIAGHFLEIGCTFSLSNIKSCVNLQRVCELGGEISQSHYYHNMASRTWNLLDPSGIIAKREISDDGIRSAFATLNSKKLNVVYDAVNGYRKYDFIPYSPSSFMGDLFNRGEIQSLKRFSQKTPGEIKYDNYGLIETQSLSYKSFRFGLTGTSVADKFLVVRSGYKSKLLYFMPQYENSFYFYFGLRDGNTAIDRLYTEYYAQCNVDYDTPDVSFTVVSKSNTFDLHYQTQNMSKIKSLTVKFNGVTLKINEDFTWDKKNSIINVPFIGKYTIRLKDTNNNVVKTIVTCTEYDYESETVVGERLYIMKYLTSYNKWKFYYKPINSKVTHIKVDGSGYGVQDGGGIEWRVLGGYEFEPNSTHTIELKDGNKILYSDTVVFNEDVTISNVDCTSDPCTITYTETNVVIGVIESNAVSNIDFTNKTFSVSKNSNNTVIFKNTNESVVIERVVSTISEIVEPVDDYDVTLRMEVFNGYGWSDGELRYNIYYEITPTFVVNKIYLNNGITEFDSYDGGTRGSFYTRYTGINDIVFEDTNGVRLRRTINTEINVTINSVSYDTYCNVSYTPIGFNVATIYSEPTYGHDGMSLAGYENRVAKSSIYSVNLSANNFSFYNGYNKYGGTNIVVHFLSGSSSNNSAVDIFKVIEANPPFEPPMYPPSDYLDE